MSYNECRTWPVAKVVDDGPASYSDLCIAPDGTICCLHERGAPGGMSYHSGDVVLAPLRHRVAHRRRRPFAALIAKQQPLRDAATDATANQAYGCLISLVRLDPFA